MRGDEALQAGVKRELDHQTQRLAQRRAEAIELGQLGVTEVSAEELEAAHASNARQQKLDAETERKRMRVRAIVNPSPSQTSTTAWHATLPKRICTGLCPRPSGAARGVCRTWRRRMWWLQSPWC